MGNLGMRLSALSNSDKPAWRGRHQRDGQRQLHYLVRLKGYSDAYNVWRPVTILQDLGCADPLPPIV